MSMGQATEENVSTHHDSCQHNSASSPPRRHRVGPDLPLYHNARDQLSIFISSTESLASVNLGLLWTSGKARASSSVAVHLPENA
jgi:hypothetical protein